MGTIADVINDKNFVTLKNLHFSSLHLKLEGLNPAGSVKMKTAQWLIADQERRGGIAHDSVLIESSSGSLGVALSLICAQRGYRFRCVVDPNTTAQNIKLMKAYGAEVVVIDTRDENGGFLGSRIQYIKDLSSKDARYLWLNQYANPENPRAHAHTTARSIAEQFEHIDYLFVGAGTTGTLMGCVQYFRANRPTTRIVAVDSVGSVTFGGEPGKRHIPGLGTSRRPEIFSKEGIDAFQMVSEADTVAMCRYLARTNGVLAGGSTGTVLAAVYACRQQLQANAVIVAISPDMGERYLDSVYDDAWVKERFGTRPLSGSLLATGATFLPSSNPEALEVAYV
ncbi:2,3-diaminopropionate biosynthesis protein SbnA [Pseudomonas sp. LB3P14]